MNSKQNEPQPSAQAGWSREAGRVAGEVGVLHSSVDLWENITHGEPREGTCVDATKRSDGVVTAGNPGYTRQQSPGASTPALAGRRKPIGKRHSESRVRENRMHGLMRGGSRTRTAKLYAALRRRLSPTLLFNQADARGIFWST